jgi:hypothetical protein
MDNLEAQTYECFERDSTKCVPSFQCTLHELQSLFPFSIDPISFRYSQYEKAIALALTHLETSRGDSALPSAPPAAASERDGEEEDLCSTSVMSETTAPVFPIAIAVVGGPLAVRNYRAGAENGRLN